MTGFEQVRSVQQPEVNVREAVEVTEGHMMYRKYIAPTTNKEFVFVKAHDANLFSDQLACEHSLSYLHHEAAIMTGLKQQGYPHLPDFVSFHCNSLVMTAARTEDGWYWDMPTVKSEQDQYVQDVLAAFDELEKVPAEALGNVSFSSSSTDVLHNGGWPQLKSETTRKKILQQMERFEPQFHAHVQQGVKRLMHLLRSGEFEELADIATKHTALPRTSLAHFDARQSNIAWHPEKGVIVVDWSWASPAPAGCDKTMLIIDVFKSGYELGNLENWSPNIGYAVTQMGYWLVRSIAPTPAEDGTVRFHQLASAASTATLLL